MLKTVEIYEPVTTAEMVQQEIKEHEEMFRDMTDAELYDYIKEHAEAGDYDNPYYMMAWDFYEARGLNAFSERH